MCFTVHSNHSKINITDYNIHIVKRVILYMYPGNKLEIISPFQKYVYYEGNIDYGSVTNKIKGHLAILLGSIEKGFHSYISFKRDEYELLYTHIAKHEKEVSIAVYLRGVIPPKSEYAINPFDGEIVSNKICLSHAIRVIPTEDGMRINSVNKLYEYTCTKLNW